MTPFISVIIPVYNAAATLQRCIDSIQSTKTDIEIICIDDGSTDNSLEVLRTLAKKDKRLKIFHQENAGAGFARNRGLSLSVGEFIMFCDADDSYLPDTINLIFDDLQHYNPDYLVFHRKANQLNGNTICWGGERETTKLLQCDWATYLNDLMLPSGHGMGVVNKVYRNSLIQQNNIQFKQFKFGEDLWFNLTYLIHCERFVEDYRAYYQQFQTENSICLKPYSDYLDLNLESIIEFASLYPAEYNRINNFISGFVYGVIIWSITRILLGIDASSYPQKYSSLKRLFSRDDVRRYVSDYKSTLAIKDDKSKICDLILSGHFIKYSVRYYYLKKIKSDILTLIRTFKA